MLRDERSRALAPSASEELRRELAVFLVKEGILLSHEARKLAAMDRIAFDDLLAHRQVAWGGTAAEVVADADAVARILDR